MSEKWTRWCDGRKREYERREEEEKSARFTPTGRWLVVRWSMPEPNGSGWQKSASGKVWIKKCQFHKKDNPLAFSNLISLLINLRR